MKEIKNSSLQSWDIYLQTPAGLKTIWMQPGEHLVVPKSYITPEVETLYRRKMIEIRNA